MRLAEACACDLEDLLILDGGSPRLKSEASEEQRSRRERRYVHEYGMTYQEARAKIAAIRHERDAAAGRKPAMSAPGDNADEPGPDDVRASTAADLAALVLMDDEALRPEWRRRYGGRLPDFDRDDGL